MGQKCLFCAAFKTSTIGSRRYKGCVLVSEVQPPRVYVHARGDTPRMCYTEESDLLSVNAKIEEAALADILVDFDASVR